MQNKPLSDVSGGGPVFFIFFDGKGLPFAACSAIMLLEKMSI